jgi:hypothetical protein
MKFEFIKYPFPHIILLDTYTEDDLNHIWLELEFLTYDCKLESPEKSGSAFINNTSIKKNKGIFLNDLYKHKDISNILRINRKVFDPLFCKKVTDADFVFGNYQRSNIDATLISYYEDSDNYPSHCDKATYTLLTWFFKEPKEFVGGNLIFSDYDNYTIIIENNKTILFPSWVRHAVTSIKMKISNPDYLSKLSCNGRYCMSQFISNY